MKVQLAIALIGGLVLMGCAKPSYQEAAAPEAAVLEFWTVSERYAGYFTDAAEGFSTETGRQVAIDAKIYSRDQIGNKLSATIHSSMGVPDLCDIHHRELDQFTQGSNLMLYPLAGEEGWSGWDAQPEALSPFIRGDFCYAVPYAQEQVVLYCNPAVFSACQIDPNQLKTWEDVGEAGRIIRQGMDIPMFFLDVENNTLFLAMMLQRNPDSAGWDLEQILGSEEYRQVVETLEAMVLEDRSVAIAPGYNIYNNLFYNAMEAVEVAAVPAELGYAAVFLDCMPALHDSVAAYPLPGWSGASPSVHLPQYGTAATLQCSDIALVREFLAYAKIGTAAYTQLTESLYVDSLAPDPATASIYPQDAGYSTYFRGNPLKLRDSGNGAWLGQSTGLHQAAERFTLELLAKMDEVG